jgi:hypothetical protein
MEFETAIVDGGNAFGTGINAGWTDDADKGGEHLKP